MTPRRLLLAAAVVLFAVVAAALLAASLIRKELASTVTLTSPVVMEVTPGESLGHIANRLQRAGAVRDARFFLWMARWREADRAIKHGRHELHGTFTIDQVLEELARTPKPILRVTIPEGLTAREIATLLEKTGAASAEGYLAVACSEELRRLVDAPPAAACAEGYLFPDTYDLVPGMSPGSIVDLQVKRFVEIMGPLMSPAPTATPGSGAAPVATPGSSAPTDPESARRALILASIIEKETAVPAERPLVAAVFANRLRVGMLLQTDPTVIYGVIDSGAPWDGNLTRAHLTTDNPYNTYKRKGLPPGPICNPGLSSLEAALRPATSRYLYFVARGDGSHEFNDNLASHNQAVRRYQLR